MPPRKAARAASAKLTDSAQNDAIAAPLTNGVAKESKRESATPAVNGDATRTAKGAAGAGRGRAKKESTPATKKESTPATNGTGAASKRKKRDESDIEEEPEETQPAPKKTKTKAAPKAPAEPAKPKPQGPMRRGGKKTEINELRYTEPLKVFLFGEGSSGELGFGATKKAIDVKRPRFNEALSNKDVVRIAAGGMHVVALTKDNQILTWGVNDNGALGRDTAEGVKLKDMKDAEADEGSDSDSDDDPTGGLNDLEATPTAVSAEHFPENTTFVDVAAGDSCSFALTTEGALYGWGTFRKNEGVLGFARGLNTARTPVYIDSLKKITQVACGTNHVIALDKDSHVWAWGNGQQNQLGRRVTERSLESALLPSKVGFHDNSAGGKSSRKITAVFCGDYHSMAIGSDGHVWAWGANNYAETGFPDNAGDDNAIVTMPRIVHSLEGKGVTTLAAGSHHNLAVTSSGDLLAWGRCDSSQTGIPMDTLNAIDDKSQLLKAESGKAKILIEPTVVPGLDDIVFAACGPDHNIVLDKQGKAFSWGFSANYQTGQGTDDDVLLPTKIDNTATREEKLVWAGAGGQYSVVASKK